MHVSKYDASRSKINLYSKSTMTTDIAASSSYNQSWNNDGEIYIVNVRWGNSMTINKKLAEKLIDLQNKAKKFNLKDFGVDQIEMLANLYFKDIIDTTNKLDIVKTIIGLSLDLSHSPKSKEFLHKYK